MHLSHRMSSRPAAPRTIALFAPRPVYHSIALISLFTSLSACSADRSTAAGETPPHSETALSADKSYKGSVSAGDSLWYSFSAEEDKSFAAILEVDNGAATVAVLGGAEGPVLQTLDGAAVGADSPGYSSTKAISSPDPHIYSIVVTGSASFQLSVHQGSDLPEVAPYVLPVGDTITGESIADLVPHDSDSFRVIGKPGDEYNIFLRVSHGDESRVVRLETLDAIGNQSIRSDGRDTALTQRATGPFRLPSNGVVNFRVTGEADSFGNTTTGEYLLYVYRIDRHPESGTAELVPSDSAINESIDFASDIDEYTFDVTEQMWVTLAMSCDPAVTPLWARVVSPDIGDTAGIYDCSSESQLLSMTGNMLLDPGSYTVRVSAPDVGDYPHTGGYTGHYKLYAYRLSGEPENASEFVAVGDTIEEESLDPPGDYDNFILRGHRGDDIDILVYGLDDRWVQYMELQLGYSSGRTEPLGIAYWNAEGDQRQGTGHIVLAEDGDYPIRVSGSGVLRDAERASPYRVVVERVSRAVEHHSEGISVGDVVSDERLDDWDDLDEFTVTGEPGQLVAATVSADPSTMGVRLEAVDLATRETLAYTTSNPTRPTGVTVPFKLDASGAAAIRIYRATDVVPGEVGAYEFDVHGFDPAPENTSAAIAIGDTVRGEWVDPLGDVDEYMFDGFAGDHLIVYFNPTSSPDPTWPLVLEVFESGNDEILGSIAVGATGAELGYWRTEEFALPESGRYVVRVRGYANELGSGEYDFTVQKAP